MAISIYQHTGTSHFRQGVENCGVAPADGDWLTNVTRSGLVYSYVLIPHRADTILKDIRIGVMFSLTKKHSFECTLLPSEKSGLPGPRKNDASSHEAHGHGSKVTGRVSSPIQRRGANTYGMCDNKSCSPTQGPRSHSLCPHAGSGVRLCELERKHQTGRHGRRRDLLASGHIERTRWGAAGVSATGSRAGIGVGCATARDKGGVVGDIDASDVILCANGITVTKMLATTGECESDRGVTPSEPRVRAIVVGLVIKTREGAPSRPTSDRQSGSRWDCHVWVTPHERTVTDHGRQHDLGKLDGSSPKGVGNTLALSAPTHRTCHEHVTKREMMRATGESEAQGTGGDSLADQVPEYNGRLPLRMCRLPYPPQEHS
jgi:hypothetical protein